MGKVGHTYDRAQDIPVQPYGYTGRRYDSETGLWYFRNRYFDSSLGRFIARDPLTYVDGMSMYRGYFAPLRLDPYGLDDTIILLDMANGDDDYIPKPPTQPAPVAVYDGDDDGDSGGEKTEESDWGDGHAGGNDFQWGASKKARSDRRRSAASLDELVDFVEEKNELDVGVSDVHVFDHGSEGTQRLGNEDITWDSPENALKWKRIGDSMSADGIIYLHACNVAGGDAGKYILQWVANAAGRPVVGWTGKCYYLRYEWYNFDYVHRVPSGEKRVFYPEDKLDPSPAESRGEGCSN
jgi:RHS repeat-associated protein